LLSLNRHFGGIKLENEEKDIRHIIEKANEMREKCGIDDLELLALKLGAEVVEIPRKNN
jgi:hypothetical protein